MIVQIYMNFCQVHEVIHQLLLIFQVYGYFMFCCLYKFMYLLNLVIAEILKFCNMINKVLY